MTLILNFTCIQTWGDVWRWILSFRTGTAVWSTFQCSIAMWFFCYFDGRERVIRCGWDWYHILQSHVSKSLSTSHPLCSLMIAKVMISDGACEPLLDVANNVNNQSQRVPSKLSYGLIKSNVLDITWHRLRADDFCHVHEVIEACTLAWQHILAFSIEKCR